MGTEGSSWKFHESIGHGSFGIVFKVENTSRTFSALKIVLRPSTIEEEEKVLRVYTVMKEMEHPNLVQILGCQHHNFSPSELEDILKTVAEDEVPKVLIAQLKIAERRGTTIAAICVEMEICGPTLREWLSHNSGQELTHNLQVLQLRIIQDIVDGVRFLHRYAIIHRDLEPANIMFSDTYDTNAFLLPVKVGDFSLAKVLHTDQSWSKTSRVTSRVGAMDYMAPEVVYGSYDYRSDIYSIGLIMFEIIQLTNARDRKILFGKIKQGKIGEIKRHPMLPTSDQLICRAIKPEIGDRFSTIEDFNAEINAAKKYPFNYTQFATGTTIGMNVLSSVVSEADLPNLETNNLFAKNLEMDKAHVKDIVSVLIQDSSIIDKRLQLYMELGLPFSEYKQLDASYNLRAITLYDFFTDMLHKWITKEGEHATVHKLLAVLKRCELVQSHDSITHNFPSNVQHIPFVSVSLSIPQRVIRALGAGAFGIVFEIEKDGTHLAQKIMIESTNTLDEKEVAHILRECELFVGKEHVNIVKVLDYQVARDILNPIENLMEVYRRKMENQTSLEQDHISDTMDTLIGRINRRSCTYFSINMELCGSTLRQWLKANENTTSLLYFRPQIAEGIISGLKYLHEENIIHRDLKPENIYFAKDPFQLPVKIGDFGHCRELQDRQSAKLTTNRCTPEYRAPEIHKGEKYGFRADLYSLGLILFEVFQIIKSGELRRQFAMLKDDEHDVIIDNPKFPNLKESIIKLTRKNTKDRVQSIDDVIIINVNDKISE